MKLLTRILLLMVTVACSAAAFGQNSYIGYVYPAGGRQGDVFTVTVRGQRLNGAATAYVSGKGVRVSVVGYEGPLGPLNRLQQEELKRRLIEIRGKRVDGQGRVSESRPPSTTERVELPDLPELRNLEQQSAQQLRRLVDKFLNIGKRPKPPIAEMVTLEVTIAANAVPGDREIRLRTALGLTNPLVFQVGSVPETREPEEDEQPPPVKPPIVLNGRIMPGEVDRFPLDLRAGQKLTVDVRARKLIPYLADAVPGWFQAIVALYDPKGREIAFNDDDAFNPDPAFEYEVPRDGQYILEIRDSIYRGREDFVYRVAMGDALSADREPTPRLARDHLRFTGRPLVETEPNDTGQASMQVKLSSVIKGVIAKAGDKDVYRIDGKAGDTVVIEIFARRMGSPLDSLVRLIDAFGKVVAWSDDHRDTESGLLTHHADSYISAKLPATGRYFVQVSDAQSQGGREHAYYLRVGPPQPDFALRATPSSLNVPSGRAAAVTVYAVRRDGWEGDIDVSLIDAPDGFVLSGARIPRGRDHVRMTLTAPAGRFSQPVKLQMEGCARIGGKTVTRPVVPADDMMQAFAYRHLVPSNDLMVVVTRKALVSLTLDMADGDRLRIPAGGSAKVSYTMRPAVPNTPVRLELSDPPAGVTLGDVSVTGRGFTLTFKVDDKQVGYADNLIVEASTEVETKNDPGRKQRITMGVLPAIPIEIVQRGSPQP